MISQVLRMMFLVGLMISSLTAPGTIIAAGSTATLHHQPAPCDPNC